ncbi:MAG: PucR family transcriptional regulator [Halanaerobiaceae bacterium]
MRVRNILNLLNKITIRNNKEKININKEINSVLFFTTARDFYDNENIMRDSLLICYRKLHEEEINYLEKKSPALILIKDSNSSEGVKSLPVVSIEAAKMDYAEELIMNKLQEERDSYRELIFSDYPDLVQTLLENNTLEKLMNRAATILGNPIIMTDESYDLLAYSSNEVEDPIWQEIIENRYCPYSIVQALKEEGFIEKLARSDTPVFLEGGQFSDVIRRLVCEVTVRGDIKGFIALLEDNRELNFRDKRILKFVTRVAAAELAKENAVSKARGKLNDDFLRDLVEGNIANLESAKNRARTLNWNICDGFQLICIKADEEGKELSRHRRSVRSILMESFPGVQVSISENEITVLLTGVREAATDSGLEKLKDYCRKNGLTAAVSRVAPALDCIKYCFQEANRAFEISNKLEQEKVLNFYSNLQLYDAVDDIGQKNLNSNLEKIIEHDKENNSDLLETLRTYYACGQNMNKTADILYVHRNTVKYRLDKIKNMLELDIQDHKNRLHLELSLLRLEMDKGI